MYRWKTNLENFSGDMAVISSCSSSNPVVSIKFVHEFHNVTSHYCQALNSVIPIFTYMVSSIVANDFNRIPRNFIKFVERYCIEDR